MIYKVINKNTNEVVDKYEASSPIEWNEYPFSDYLHLEDIPEISFNPNLKIWENPYQFLLEFTIPEQADIRDAARTNSVIEAFLKMLDVAPNVRNDDPNLPLAMQLFVQLGLLTQERMEQIMYG